MTPSEALKRECEEITQRTGYYIPPYRLINLMKAAQKITDLLMRADLCMTYKEALFVLRIVSGAISGLTEGDQAVA